MSILSHNIRNADQAADEVGRVDIVGAECRRCEYLNNLGQHECVVYNHCALRSFPRADESCVEFLLFSDVHFFQHSRLPKCLRLRTLVVQNCEGGLTVHGAKIEVLATDGSAEVHMVSTQVGRQITVVDYLIEVAQDERIELLRAMNQVSEKPSNSSLNLVGKQIQNHMHYLEKVQFLSVEKVKYEHAEAISCGYYKGLRPTCLKLLVLKDLELRSTGGKIVGHPTVECIVFANVTVKRNVFINSLPNIKSVVVADCTGRMSCRDVSLDTLVILSQVDQDFIEFRKKPTEIVQFHDYLENLKKNTLPTSWSWIEIITKITLLFQDHTVNLEKLTLESGSENKIYSKRGLLGIKYCFQNQKRFETLLIDQQKLEVLQQSQLKYFCWKNVIMSMECEGLLINSLRVMVFSGVLFENKYKDNCSIDCSQKLNTIIFIDCENLIEIKNVNKELTIVASQNYFQILNLFDNQWVKLISITEFYDRVKQHDAESIYITNLVQQANSFSSVNQNDMQENTSYLRYNKSIDVNKKFVVKDGCGKRDYVLWNAIWKYYWTNFRNLRLEYLVLKSCQIACLPAEFCYGNLLLRGIAFQDVIFDNVFGAVVVLDSCQRLEEVKIRRCQNKIQLKNLRLKRILMDSDDDINAFDLIESTVDVIELNRDQKDRSPEFLYFDNLIETKAVDIVEENSSIIEFSDEEDMCCRVEDGSVVFIYNFSNGAKKREYLNNICWEHWKFNTTTTSRLFYFRNIRMLLGCVGGDQFPGHPEATQVAFHDVEFENDDDKDIYFERSPKMKVLFFINCKGVLRLDGLQLDMIVVGCEEDKLCYKLNGTTVGSIVMLDEFTSLNCDPMQQLEQHFVKQMKNCETPYERSDQVVSIQPANDKKTSKAKFVVVDGKEETQMTWLSNQFTNYLSFYTFNQLEVVNIADANLEDIVIAGPSLRKLYFETCELKGSSVEKCPVLELIHICQCTGFVVVNVKCLVQGQSECAVDTDDKALESATDGYETAQNFVRNAKVTTLAHEAGFMWGFERVDVAVERVNTKIEQNQAKMKRLQEDLARCEDFVRFTLEVLAKATVQ